jgi:hypothetical protein
MSTSYHPTNIRALLVAGFSDEELRRLCFDDFRDVYDQLAHNSGKKQIVDELIEYCDRNKQIEKLLTLAQAHNSAQYESHKPYFKTTSSPPQSPAENPSRGGSVAAVSPHVPTVSPKSQRGNFLANHITEVIALAIGIFGCIAGWRCHKYRACCLLQLPLWCHPPYRYRLQLSLPYLPLPLFLIRQRPYQLQLLINPLPLLTRPLNRLRHLIS